MTEGHHGVNFVESDHESEPFERRRTPGKFQWCIPSVAAARLQQVWGVYSKLGVSERLSKPHLSTSKFGTFVRASILIYTLPYWTNLLLSNHRLSPRVIKKSISGIQERRWGYSWFVRKGRNQTFSLSEAESCLAWAPP